VVAATVGVGFVMVATAVAELAAFAMAALAAFHHDSVVAVSAD